MEKVDLGSGKRFPHISMDQSSFMKLKWLKLMEQVRWGEE
jgi:hypothetical protein